MGFDPCFVPALALVMVPIAAVLGGPACGHCDAAAECSEDEVQVESCDGLDDCREVEVCDSIAYCQAVDAPQCTASPACTPPAIEVDTCPSGSTCENVTACGSTIICATDTNPNCMSTAECAANQFCDFPDGQCGAGDPGVCTALPMVCTDGPAVCYCDGTLTMDADISCEGHMGRDFDETGTACNYPATAIPCGHLVCDQGTTDYCSKTTDDTGGPPYVNCSTAPQGCDPAECACLTDLIDGCG